MAAVRKSKRRTRLMRKRKKTMRKRKLQLLRRKKQAMRRRRMKLARRRKLAIRKMRKRRGHKKRHAKSRKIMVKRGTRGRKMRSQPKKSPKQSMRRTSDEFVSKVLRQLHRDKVPISTKAKGKMTSFVRRLYGKLASKARSSKHGLTIGTKDLQKVLKQMMHNEPGLELIQTIQKGSHRH